MLWYNTLSKENIEVALFVQEALSETNDAFGEDDNPTILKYMQKLAFVFSDGIEHSRIHSGYYNSQDE